MEILEKEYNESRYAEECKDREINRKQMSKEHDLEIEVLLLDIEIRKQQLSVLSGTKTT